MIFGETLRFRGKKIRQNLPKNCLKSTKMVTTVCKLSKIFRGSMPPDPPRAFFILNMLQNDSAGKKKTSQKYVKIWCPLPEKFSEYAADKNIYQRAFSVFLGLTSLCLVNIQPNSKFHPPHQNFLVPLLSAGSKLFFLLEPPPFEICWVRPCDDVTMKKRNRKPRYVNFIQC